MSQDFVRFSVSGLCAQFYVSGLRAHVTAAGASVSEGSGSFGWPGVAEDESSFVVVELDSGTVPDGVDGLVCVTAADEELQ
jgi:hypothetical protein